MDVAHEQGSAIGTLNLDGRPPMSGCLDNQERVVCSHDHHCYRLYLHGQTLVRLMFQKLNERSRAERLDMISEHSSGRPSLGAPLPLLAELIAQLKAILEQNQHTRADLQDASERIEASIVAVRAATEGSSSPLVAETLPHWEHGLENLDQARALMAGGDARTNQYIDHLEGRCLKRS